MRKDLRRMLPVLLLCAGCENPPTDRPAGSEGTAVPTPVSLDVPAAPGSAQPWVAPARDGFLVSWTEPADSGHALRFASLTATTQWSDPGTAARGTDWFVNWADFPSITELEDGGLLAHWLQRSGPDTYAYDVMVAYSTDGESWSEPARPHGDGTETEHGFVSIVQSSGAAGLVWLDGRGYADGPDGAATSEMGVRFTWLRDGIPGDEILLDARACDCCQTAAVATSQGVLVAYRDRSNDEIRDIAVTRFADGVWTEPRIVHADGWHITGCPVNGPQADAHGDDVVLAWYTQAQDTARVQVAWSGDAGSTFAAPVRVDDGAPLGRVDVVLLADHSALVVWLERAGEGAEIRGRRVRADGTTGEMRVIAVTSAQRSSGFPRMARSGDRVLVAWTEPGTPSRVRAALLDFAR